MRVVLNVIYDLKKVLFVDSAMKLIAQICGKPSALALINRSSRKDLGRFYYKGAKQLDEEGEKREGYY